LSHLPAVKNTCDLDTKERKMLIKNLQTTIIINEMNYESSFGINFLDYNIPAGIPRKK